MLSTSSSGPSVSETMLSGINVENLMLQTECLPILIGIHQFRHLAALEIDKDVGHIGSYLAKNRKSTDIEVYWSQAAKYLSTAKHAQINSTFECARAVDHFWMVLNELTSQSSVESGEHSNIFNDRVYLRVLNSIIPIVVSCFPVKELEQLMKPLVTSHLSADHLSNLAFNLPSITGDITEVVKNYMRDSLEPAILWRCSRILLRIASCDRQLAKCVRTSLAATREHPLLCLDLTMRYIHDTENFVDNELCSKITSIGTDSNWLLKGLRDSDLLDISALALARLKSLLLAECVPSMTEDKKQWQSDVTRCVRISATCSTVYGGSSYNTSTSSSCCDKFESIKLVVLTLMDAAERETTLCDLPLSPDILDQKENFVEVVLRQAIVLLTSSYAIHSSLRRRMRDESAPSSSSTSTSSREKGALQEHQQSLSALLQTSLRLQERLLSREERRHAGSAAEAARCFNLTFRLAVSHKSIFELRALCVFELRLMRFTDFMSDSGDDVSRVMNELATIVSPSSRIDMADSSSVCREFEDLHEPVRVSSTEERAGDWISCLSLMLFFDHMYSYRPLKAQGEREGEIVRDSHQQELGPSMHNVLGSTHTLMVRVLSKLQWPPHSHVQNCLDRWLRRCVGAGFRVLTTASRMTNACNETLCLGLPLLQNEAVAFSRTLFCVPLNRVGINYSAASKDQTDSILDKKTSQLEVQGPSAMSDVCVSFLKNCGYRNNYYSDDILDEDCSSDMMELEGPGSSFKGHPDSQNVTPPELICSGWCGVMACYTALHYASLSMTLEELTGRNTDQPCGVMYRGPYVCDLRSLPLKSSIQYLLSNYRDYSCRGVRESVVAHALYGILSKTVDMVFEMCPEVTLPDRLRCFNFPHIASLRAPLCAARKSLIMTSTLLSLLSTEKEGTSDGSSLAQLHRMAYELILMPNFAEYLGTSVAPSSQLYMILHQLLNRSSDPTGAAFKGPHGSEGVGQWLVWRALHDAYPCPQQLELLTVNILYGCRHCGPSPRFLTSYEQLVQDPLQLFHFPLSILRDPFLLRIMCFITRAALVASKSSAHLALAIKHRAAQDSLTAAVKLRSTYEASLYLHEATYLDLQDVIAARMTFGLWEEVNDDLECAHTGEHRLMLNEFLHHLIEGNPRLSGLLLCHQLTPRSLELLMSCDVSVPVSLISSHTQSLQDITEALKVLPPLSALALDPANTSSSYIFNASATGAASLSSSAEIAPKDVERLLLHSVCLLCLPCRCAEQNDEDSRKISDVIKVLAEAIPAFLLCVTNSLNAHLRSKDTRLIELYSTRIVHEILGRHRALGDLLVGMALKGEKIITANTSALHMVAKSWGARGNQKVEDDVAMKARPAVKALKKIIEEASSTLSVSISIPQNTADFNTVGQQKQLQSNTASFTPAASGNTHSHSHIPVGAARSLLPLKTFRDSHADVAENAASRKKQRADS